MNAEAQEMTPGWSGITLRPEVVFVHDRSRESERATTLFVVLTGTTPCTEAASIRLLCEYLA